MNRRTYLALCGMTATAGGCLSSGSGEEDEKPTVTCKMKTSRSREKTGGSSGGTWPTFQHDAHNTGHSPTANPPEGCIDVQWQYDFADHVRQTPPGVQRDDYRYAMPSSVSVGDGTVYVCGTQDSSGLSILRTLDARTGEERWWYEARNGNVSAPTLAGNTIYFASGNTMQAVNVHTQRERWHFKPSTPKDALPRIAAAPRHVDGTLYFGSTSGIVYALDAATGEKQWQFAGVDPYAARNDLYSSRFRAAVAVANGTVFAGSDDRHLYTLDAETGKKYWSFIGDDLMDIAPTVTGGIVYAGGTNTRLYALSIQEGTVKWTFDKGTGIEASPAIANGTVYVPTGESWGSLFLYALEATTGTIEWKAPIGIPESGPCVAGDTVYIGDQSGLLAINTTTGKRRWYVETGDGVYASAAIIDGSVYITDNDGTVYGLW